MTVVMFLSIQLPCITWAALWEQNAESQATREWAKEVGVSIQEGEHLLDAKLFLDDYPRWDIEGPHCPIILHTMFLHATREGQKEAERFICQGQ